MVYAVLFSVAYIHLDTGAGALLLFGAIQFAMVIHGLFKGESLSAMRACGLVLLLMAGELLPCCYQDESTAALQCAYDDRFRISTGRPVPVRGRAGGRQRRLILFSPAPMALALSLLFYEAGVTLMLRAFALSLLSGAVASASALYCGIPFYPPRLYHRQYPSAQRSCYSSTGGVVFWMNH